MTRIGLNRARGWAMVSIMRACVIFGILLLCAGARSSDLTTDENGDDIAVGVSKSKPDNGRVIKRRLSDGQATVLTPGGYASHTSTRNVDRPGWAYVTYQHRGPTWPPFWDEVVAVKLDGSLTVKRIAHLHTREIDYLTEAHAVPSPDGKRVLWASDWESSTGRPIGAYVARLIASANDADSKSDDSRDGLRPSSTQSPVIRKTPFYVYGARFEPPAGRVVHGMGQWEQYNAKLLPFLPAELRPASKLMFIDIGDTPRGWRPEGIRNQIQRCDGEGFIPHLDIGLRGGQPSHAALAALADPHFGIDHEVASTTRFDERIQDLVRIVKEFGKPVIVRIGGEFNGRWNGYHPYAYPKAFRKIVATFRVAKVDNAAFVWCYEPAAPGDFDQRSEAGEYKWFPGADVIDWFAIDWFNREDFTGPLTGDHRGENAMTPHGRTRKFLDMAAARRKPVMIAESGPARYDLSDPTQADAAWREWFQPYFQIIADHDEIKWFHLISFDWTRSSYYVQTGWKNNDFTASDTLMQRRVAELRKPRYLHAGDKALLKDYSRCAATGAARGEGVPPLRLAGISPAHPVGAEPAQVPEDKRTELAKFDEPAAHLPARGPGGTEWDTQYRSFIQPDQNAAAKDWNIDPNHVAAMGGSAGAHLAAWVGLHDDLATPDSPDPIERLSRRLTCFVVLAGPMDLLRVDPRTLAKAGVRGESFAEAFTAAVGATTEQLMADRDIRRRLKEASPVFLVSPDDPPAMVVGAGSAEIAVVPPTVPETINDPHSVWQGALLADALRRAGVEIVARLGPEVGKDPQADVTAVAGFLTRHLKTAKR